MTYQGRIPVIPRPAPNDLGWNFDAVLETLLKMYDGETALEVDFRQLVPFGSGIDRATHLVHSYPAKLIPNIPIFFANCRSLATRGSSIYDPFCGSGTVLVEGALNGSEISGANSNPLARLITSVKTTAIEPKRLKRSLAQILRRYPTMKPRVFDPVVDPTKWFDSKTSKTLGKLIAAIDTEKADIERDFFRVCFSQCVKKVSRADPRMSVPVLRRAAALPTAEAAVDLIPLFVCTAETNFDRVATLPVGTRARFLGTDARSPLPENVASSGVDLILTSPPYAGAQKYIRASSLSIGWLHLAQNSRLRPLEATNIGREHLSRSERENNSLDRGERNGRGALSGPRRKSASCRYLCDIYWRDVCRCEGDRAFIETGRTYGAGYGR